MRIFVDGYNLIGAATRRMSGFELDGSEESRDRLLKLIARFRSGRKDRITVFFDGGPEGAHLPRRQFARGLDVLFSDPGSDADSDIKTAVSHDPNPRDVRVVTSDRAIQAFVSGYGATVTEARVFLDEIQDALREKEQTNDEPIEKFEGPSSADEVNYWMRVFGEEPKDDG